MIYGQDEPIALPVADLYDSGMMQMYLTAVKDQYDQGRKDYENFVSKYGDFVSPIRSDVDYWNAHTIDPLNNLIEDMYANGIDPTRSPEARAIIQRQMRKVPYAKLSQMRQSADAANEYLKNRGAMAAKGLYNSDFENFILGQQGLPDFEHWDTSVNGIWNRTSPAEFKDLNQWTSHIFDDMKGEDLGLDKTGRYRVFGVTEDAMNRNLTPHIYGLAGSDLGQYYLDQAKRSLIAEGNTNPTDADVLNRLRRDIITANKERLTKTIDADDYAKMAQQHSYNVSLENLRTANDIAADRAKQATRYYYDTLLAGGGADEIPLSAQDQLAYQQRKNYMEKQGEFVNKQSDAYKEQVSRYNKLTNNYKKIATEYGKAYRKLQNRKSTRLEKFAARTALETLDKIKDPGFVSWKNQFLSRMGGRNWQDVSTTEGLAGYDKQSQGQLRTRSRAIFNTYNVVPDLTDGQKLDINKQLGYTNDADTNVRTGIMSTNKDLADIVIAEMTGNRRYRSQSLQSTVSRLLKGKTITIENKNVPSRIYGAGNIKRKQVNVVVEKATVSDSDVVKQLDLIGEDRLKQIGIKKTTVTRDDVSRPAYEVEIATKLYHGQGRADSGSYSDKRVGGTSDAKTHRVTRQAREIAHDANDMMKK